MLGFYPYCPGKPEYVLTAPVFSRAVIRLHPDYYAADSLVIEAPGAADTSAYVRRVSLGGRPLRGYTVSHEALTGGRTLRFEFGDGHPAGPQAATAPSFREARRSHQKNSK